MITFKDRFKDLRLSKNLTQEQVAKQFNINKSSVSRYEQGAHYPEIELLIEFADFFDVSVDYLLGRTNYPNNIEYVKSYPDNLTHEQAIIILKKLKEAGVIFLK